jgi:hypothetical protein
MATEDHTENHETRKLSAGEVDHLADRMLSRAVSVLFDVRPELRSDMLLASGCLRFLARTSPDGVTVDVWRGSC